MNRFYGKYRGKVTNNVDPMLMGRVQVSVPAVLGDATLAWAMPCSPFAGPGVGFFAVPPVGANAWVEFEGGDPDYPILAGCFWALGEPPARPPLPGVTVLQSDGISISMSALPPKRGLVIEVGPPAAAVPMTLSLDDTGITLSTAGRSVKVNPVSVSINDGHLEVL
jgi:hypothetical protein